MSREEADQTVKFVIGVFRHGIRAPCYSPVPNDPYKDFDKYFPEGVHELTKEGKKLMAEVGKCFRLRYDRLLGEMYSSDVATFRSTSTSRTMMSTEIVAQTIYPPKGYQKWDEQQTWHPIPVWADCGEIDKINFIGPNNLCPRYAKLRKEALEKISGTDMERLYESVSHHAGKTMKSPEDLLRVWDSLNFEDLNGLQLPKWTEEFYPEPLRYIHKRVLKAWVADTPEMLLLTSGPLLHFVKNQLRDKANNKTKPDRKVVLFGGHDTSLVGLLHAIKNVEPLFTTPGAMLVFELHEIDGQHIVKAFYLDLITKGKYFFEISIPTCPEPCSLDDFLTSIESFDNDEWKRMLS